MVAARGITPGARVCAGGSAIAEGDALRLYVKEIAVYFTGGPTNVGQAKWQDDPEANAIMSLMMKARRGARRLPCSRSMR